MYEFIESALEWILKYGIILLEFIGSAIILFTAVRCMVMLFRSNRRNNVRLMLGQGISLALEFKLGSEVLRTVIARDMSELLIVGATVVLRAAMTFLIHWEIKNEKAEKEHEGQKE